MWSAGFTAVFELLSAAQAQFFYSHFYKAEAAKSGKYGDGTNVCTLGCALLTKNDVSIFSGILLISIIRQYFAECVFVHLDWLRPVMDS